VVASVFVFQIDGIGTKFLLANSITEFLHGLGSFATGWNQRQVQPCPLFADRYRNFFGRLAAAPLAMYPHVGTLISSPLSACRASAALRACLLRWSGVLLDERLLYDYDAG
jgi:hypothetical protein